MFDCFLKNGSQKNTYMGKHTCIYPRPNLSKTPVINSAVIKKICHDLIGPAFGHGLADVSRISFVHNPVKLDSVMK